LIGQKREGQFEHEILLSRSRFLAPATNSLRFYREYFKPRSEVTIEKDRLRWFIKYKETEFYVNLDNVSTPALGYFLEIKSRTWSRKDADNKSRMLNELLELLGASGNETAAEDYIDIMTN
jgi:5-methylthioadenosine/S-adenosylhomocysteine deaminase